VQLHAWRRAFYDCVVCAWWARDQDSHAT
jgi:hypothetical protein